MYVVAAETGLNSWHAACFGDCNSQWQMLMIQHHLNTQRPVEIRSALCTYARQQVSDLT